MNSDKTWVSTKNEPYPYIGDMNAKQETIKGILGNTTAFLNDLECLIDNLNSGLYKPMPLQETCNELREPREPSVLEIVQEQREKAERILVKLQDILNGMW